MADEALFWVGGAQLGWLGHYFGWVGVSGGEWGWVLFDNTQFSLRNISAKDDVANQMLRI